MKRRFLQIITLLFSICLPATTRAQEQGKEHIVFYPQWTPQSQFLGFYVAQELGYYDEAGLDVEIKHIGKSENHALVDKLISGQADIVGQQLMQSIVNRSKGLPIVNVMQITQNSGLCCVANKPLDTPSELNNLKISRWNSGFAEIIEIIEHDMDLSIRWIPSLCSTNLFIYGAVDATLCYTYSEYFQLMFAKGEIVPSNVLRFSDFGFNYPEDGLYVTESYYNDHKQAIDRFVAASAKGWQYVKDHKEEALQIVFKYTERNHIATNYAYEKCMLDEYLRLQVSPASGKADFTPVSENTFNEIVKKLKDNDLIGSTINYKDLIR